MATALGMKDDNYLRLSFSPLRDMGFSTVYPCVLRFSHLANNSSYLVARLLGPRLKASM